MVMIDLVQDELEMIGKIHCPEVNKLRIVSPGRTALVAGFGGTTTEDTCFYNVNRFFDGPTITMISERLTNRRDYG